MIMSIQLDNNDFWYRIEKVDRLMEIYNLSLTFFTFSRKKSLFKKSNSLFLKQIDFGYKERQKYLFTGI